MSNFILDTSVAVSQYIDEIFSESARYYQTQLIKQQDRLYVPPLHFWEFSNVLRTLKLKKILSTKYAEKIYRLHFQAPLYVIEPERDEILEIAFTYQATTYNAVYIQLALSTEFPLLTAEKKNRGWVSKLGDLAIPLS